MTYTETMSRQLRKLDRQTAQRIRQILSDRILTADDPRQLGVAKVLVGTRGMKWRFRIGDYRVVCEIREDTKTVIAERVGHRRDMYLR